MSIKGPKIKSRLNGTIFPHKLLEAIYDGTLNIEEIRLISFITRKTIGWQKEMDWLTQNHIRKSVGLLAPAISRASASLIKRGYLKIEGKRGRRYFSLTSKCF